MSIRPTIGRWPVLIILILALLTPRSSQSQVQFPEGSAPDEDVIEMTLERMVGYALNNSYRMRFLNLDIEQTRQEILKELDLDLGQPNRVATSRPWHPPRPFRGSSCGTRTSRRNRLR